MPAVESIRGGRFKYFFEIPLSQCFCAGGGAAGSTKHTSLVFQLDLFSFSTDRYRRFYPQQLSSAHQSVVFFKHICFRLKSQTLFNISR